MSDKPSLKMTIPQHPGKVLKFKGFRLSGFELEKLEKVRKYFMRKEVDASWSEIVCAGISLLSALSSDAPSKAVLADKFVDLAIQERKTDVPRLEKLLNTARLRMLPYSKSGKFDEQTLMNMFGKEVAELIEEENKSWKSTQK